jgi:hypothetical protein
MRTPRRTTVILLAGAVVLASGAYAIGSQAGGGSADARDSRADGPPFPPGEPFDDLADALGVDADELRDALADFGSRHMSERRDDFAAALAGALGKSTADVEKALDSLPNGPHDGCAGPGPFGAGLSELARALDVTPAELRRALRQVGEDARTEHADKRDDLAKFLADRFNLSVDKVEKALDDSLPTPPKLEFRGGPGPGFEGPGWHISVG